MKTPSFNKLKTILANNHFMLNNIFNTSLPYITTIIIVVVIIMVSSAGGGV